MNKFGFTSTVLLLISLLWLFSTSVNADGGNVGSVSPALDIIASRMCMIKSCKEGGRVDFSAEDFDLALGVDCVSGITFTDLPSEGKGVLMLGEMAVEEGQRVDRNSIGELTFKPDNGVEGAELKFTYDEGGYCFTCVVRNYDGNNYAPTSLGVDDCFFFVRTFKNLAISGNMRVKDPEGDTVAYEITEYPKKGLLFLTDRSNGDYTYTPIKNYIGKDRFSYVAVDEYGNRSAEMTVTVSVSASASGTVFEDMIGDPCHYGAVMMSDLGIMEGTEDSTGKVFMPNVNVTAYELISCSLRAVGIADKEATRAEIVEAARRLDATFEDEELDRHITRAEACVILDRLLSVDPAGAAPNISDKNDIPFEAEKAVYTMAHINVIDLEGGYVYPHELLDRGELARMLSVILDLE